MGFTDEWLTRPDGRGRIREPLDSTVVLLSAIDRLSAAVAASDTAPALPELERLAGAVDTLSSLLVSQPAPIVEVAAPPMPDVVVDSVGIARAVRDALLEPLAEQGDALRAAVDELAALRKKINSVARGGGGGGGGATEITLRTGTEGAVVSTDNPLAVVEVGSVVTPVVATVTDAGDTTLHTPAAGKAIRLHWFSAINDPDEASTPLVKVSLGATELYRAYAVAHRQVFDGAVGDALVVNLSGAASVAVTAHIEELMP